VEAAAAPRVRRLALRYEVTLRAVPAPARSAYLWIPHPARSEDQMIHSVRVVSAMPHTIVREPRYGNHAFRFGARAGVAEQRAVVEIELTRRERIRRPGGTAAAASSGDGAIPLEAWLQADRRVPIDERVRAWALETVGGKTGALERARAVYDHVVTSLRYDKSGTGWGQGDILWACDARRGNCTDFHAVFIGYTRALGIPARFEMGFPLPPQRGEGEIPGYHCWAQFHLEGFGWVPVDASEAHKDAGRREYFFGAHDENRVLFTLGRDLLLPGMKGAPLNFFIYPYAEVDGRQHDAVEHRVTYRDLAAGPSAR
jgi:transglutaminase-like putative cysteine protease